MRLPANRLRAALLLAPVGLVLLVALAELFFRFVLPAPGAPGLAFVDGVLRHTPGQRGEYRNGSICAPFSINAKGWNSAHADYPAARGKGLRIAVVGGALAEALEVPPSASMAEHLERALEHQPGGVEVFSYGMDGAPLSQHLLVARKAALPARPDLLIVLLAPEDISASHQAGGGPYAAHFQKLRLDPEDMVEELPPAPYAPTFIERLRKWSATVRMLCGARAPRPGLAERLLRRNKPDRRFEAAASAAAPAVEGPSERESLDRRATRYLLGRLQAEAAAAGANLLVVMDGPHEELAAGASPQELDRALETNRLAAEEAELLGVSLLDLSPVFAEDYRRHGEPHGFPHKPAGAGEQWNAYGHAVAAKAVVETLEHLGWLRPDPT